MTAGPITTLLVIEDNPGDARLIREMLSEDDARSADVVQVGSIGEAEKHLAANDVDVILLDLGLPDAQGLDAVRRAHAAAPNIPLVILTGLDDESVATRALQVGAQDYLVKGEIQPRGLSRALRYAVERSLLERALFAETELAQVTLASIGDAVASTDVSGRINFLNAVGQDLTGWSLDEARTKSIGTVLNLHDAVSGKPLRLLHGVTRPPDRMIELPTRATLVRCDGVRVAVEGCLAPIHERDGRPGGTVIVFRDVTERRVAERATRRSEERFERLFDANTIGITIADLSGRTLEANDVFLAMLGYTRAELLAKGLGWDELSAPEFRELNAVGVAELLATGVAQPCEKEYVRSDGTRVPVLVGVALLEATEGTCISYVVDLSGRRRLEDQLRQAQKMEAIGRVAGGVAHDFSNLLTVILGHANVMVDELGERDPVRESAVEIRDAAKRAATMTRQLLAFSRRQVLQPTVLDVNVILANLDLLIRRMIGEGIELEIEARPGVGRILADGSQIEQVLLNLAVNARDAMPNGGSLRITLGEADVDGRGAAFPNGLAAGRYVTIAVADSGAGMAPDVRAKVFEPFFTTKDRDKGTGLGLATAYGIIKQSGGNIEVASELGRGATFTIFLPRVGAEPALLPVIPVVPAVRRRTATRRGRAVPNRRKGHARTIA